MNKKEFGFGTQIRKSPYFDATVRWGAKDFSVYNHMYIPRDFGSPEENFWNLINDAILCDVAVERQGLVQMHSNLFNYLHQEISPNYLLDNVNMF